MMRLLALAAVLWPGVAGAISLTEYAARRAKLRTGLEGSAAVLYGRTDKDAEDDRNGFFQEPNFFYLTGIADPGVALLITADGDTLYLPKRDAKTELWHGKRLTLDDDVAKLTGMRARSIDALDGDLKALESGKVLRVDDESLRKSIAVLRMTKSLAELELIQEAIAGSIAGHRASWAAVRPGRFEYEIAARISGTFLERGCRRNAFAPIVGSGPNGLVLHYSRNSRRMDAGELVLMDAGAECDAYVGDITRTVPVNGKFTPRQREVYNAVLQANRAVIAAAKPGVTVKQLKQVALVSLDTDGKNLARFLPHGVSHHVGLEVHDAADDDAPLLPGAVITVEPGVYIPQEGIGIRIEDMVLITAEGARLLTSSLPSEPDAIERAMAAGKQ